MAGVPKIVVFGHAAAEDRMREIVSRIAVGQCDCRMFPISEDVSTWRDSGVLSALDACDVAVFAFCKEANASAAVSACVTAAFRRRKPIVPFLLENVPFLPPAKTPYAPELDYCLGPVEYIDGSRTDAGRKLNEGLQRILRPETETRKSFRWPKWAAAILAIVVLAVLWRVCGPGNQAGFVLFWEQVMSSALTGVCEDYAGEIDEGRVLVVMLDCVTGDYAAFERTFANGEMKEVPRTVARENAVLSPVEADRLMIPILAATAMRRAGVSRSVAIGGDDWNECGAMPWNLMLGEKPLEQGLASMHLSTALKGRGVAADVRRYSATPYHLLQGLLGIVGEAHGSPGFDYCGGPGNAKAILEKMRYDGAFGLVTGAVLCEEDQAPAVQKRRGCNAAGAVGYEDTVCMLFVRIEADLKDDEFDIADETMNLWRTIGIVAKAADEKWGGNGR